MTLYEGFGVAALIGAIAVSIAAAIGRWLRPKPVSEYWSSLVIWCLQLLVSMVAVFWVGFQGISTPGCSPNCNWDLLGYNYRGFQIAAASVQLVTLLLIVGLRRHTRVRIVPWVGIAVTVVLCAISTFVAYNAMLWF